MKFEISLFETDLIGGTIAILINAKLFVLFVRLYVYIQPNNTYLSMYVGSYLNSEYINMIINLNIWT